MAEKEELNKPQVDGKPNTPGTLGMPTGAPLGKSLGVNAIAKRPEEALVGVCNEVDAFRVKIVETQAKLMQDKMTLRVLNSEYRKRAARIGPMIMEILIMNAPAPLGQNIVDHIDFREDDMTLCIIGPSSHAQGSREIKDSIVFDDMDELIEAVESPMDFTRVILDRMGTAGVLPKLDAPVSKEPNQEAPKPEKG